MPAQPNDEPAPQPVVSPLTQAAVFLVLTIRPGGEDTVRDLLPDLSGLGRTVGFRIPEGALAVVTGIGSDAWDRLFDGPRPRELHPFQALAGARHTAPATAGDLLFHVRANRMDLCFEFATRVMRRLDGAVDVAELTIEDQERAIGRSKLDDIEMPDDVKPANSHVALNTIIGTGGEQRQIVRANMPFGNPGKGEFGTYYIGYAATPAVTEEMLRNMFVGLPPGNTDRILDFSAAVTGGLFFAPCADFLDDPPGPPAAGTAGATGAGVTGAETGSTPDVPGDGSLGIGSLRA